MATLSDFTPALRPWLQAVWNNAAIVLGSAKKKGHTEGAWLVYDLYNPPGSVKVPDLAADLFRFRLDQYRRIYNEIKIASQNGKNALDDFYHFDRKAKTYEPYFRIYARTKKPAHDNAIGLANQVLLLMRSYDGITKFKIAGPGMPEERADSMVIWLPHQIAVSYVLMHMKKEPFARYYKQEDHCTPYGTKQVKPGLAWAGEPPRTSSNPQHGTYNLTAVWRRDNHSFGSYVAGAIYLGLLMITNDFKLARERTINDFLASVLQQFRAATVDANAPHKLVSDKYLQGGGNPFIAMHTRVIHSKGAGDLITSDHTPLGKALDTAPKKSREYPI